MRVKILKAELGIEWYVNHIGEIFEVDDDYDVCEHELVRIDTCSDDTYCIKRGDCEEVGNKVFCKDCEFFKYYDAGGDAGWICKYIIRREDTAKETGGRVVYVDSYEDQNKNNDCKYFKRKVGLFEKIRGFLRAEI